MMIVISVISLVVLFAPLLLVSPIGARNFLPTYVLLLVVVSTLLSNLPCGLRCSSVGGMEGAGNFGGCRCMVEFVHYI
jgi:hypothetical protein